MAAQSKLHSSIHDVPPEIYRIMATFMPPQSVKSFRLTKRAVSNSLDAVYFFTRFYEMFPEMLKCGEAFALALVQAREDSINVVRNYVMKGTNAGPTIRFFFEDVISERNATKLGWILDAIDFRLKASDLAARVAQSLCVMAVTQGWYLGISMIWTSVYGIWDEVNNNRLKWLGGVLCKSEDAGKEAAGFHLLRKCCEEFTEKPWNIRKIESFFHAFTNRAQCGLTTRAMKFIQRSGITFDLVDSHTLHIHQRLLAFMWGEGRLSTVSEVLSFFPPLSSEQESTTYVLFYMTKYAAAHDRLDIAIEVTERISKVWKKDHQPVPAEFAVYVINGVVRTVESDPTSELKKV